MFGIPYTGLSTSSSAGLSSSSPATSDPMSEFRRMAAQFLLPQFGKPHESRQPAAVPEANETFSFVLTKSMIVQGNHASSRYICDVCNNRFMNPYALRRHYVRKHIAPKYRPTILNDDIPINSSYEDSTRGVNSANDSASLAGVAGCQGIYTCNYCVAVFDEKPALKVHLATHNNERLHDCGECGRRFALRQNLMMHQKTHNAKQTRRAPSSSITPQTNFITGNFVCDFCGRSFARMRFLRRHERVHIIPGHRQRVTLATGLPRYDCPTCMRPFHNKFHLINHDCRRIALDGIKAGIPEFRKRVVQCDLCTKKFTTLSNLRRHRALAHKLPTESYSPDSTPEEQSYQYLNKFNLQKYHKRDTNFKEFTPDCFNFQGDQIAAIDLTSSTPLDFSLKNMMSHACSVCNQGFSGKAALIDHVSSHASTFPYKCDVCLRLFARPGDLLAHYSQYHAGNPTSLMGSAESLPALPVSDVSMKNANENQLAVDQILLANEAARKLAVPSQTFNNFMDAYGMIFASGDPKQNIEEDAKPLNIQPPQTYPGSDKIGNNPNYEVTDDINNGAIVNPLIVTKNPPPRIGPMKLKKCHNLIAMGYKQQQARHKLMQAKYRLRAKLIRSLQNAAFTNNQQPRELNGNQIDFPKIYTPYDTTHQCKTCLKRFSKQQNLAAHMETECLQKSPVSTATPQCSRSAFDINQSPSNHIISKNHSPTPAVSIETNINKPTLFPISPTSAFTANQHLPKMAQFSSSLCPPTTGAGIFSHLNLPTANLSSYFLGSQPHHTFHSPALGGVINHSTTAGFPHSMVPPVSGSTAFQGKTVRQILDMVYGRNSMFASLMGQLPNDVIKPPFGSYNFMTGNQYSHDPSLHIKLAATSPEKSGKSSDSGFGATKREHRRNPEYYPPDGSKPFECELCSQRFRRKCHLARHMIIHSEGRQYRAFPCRLCNLEFTSQSSLYMHRRKSHSSSFGAGFSFQGSPPDFGSELLPAMGTESGQAFHPDSNQPFRPDVKPQFSPPASDLSRFNSNITERLRLSDIKVE